MPDIGAVQGDCQWLSKLVWIPTGHVSAQCIAAYEESTTTQSYIHKQWPQPIDIHVSYPTDSVTATSLGTVYHSRLCVIGYILGRNANTEAICWAHLVRQVTTLNTWRTK